MPNLINNEIIAGFVPWVAKQNPAQAYQYHSTTHCAFAQYLKALGYSDVLVSGFSFDAGPIKNAALPDSLGSALGNNRKFGGPPRTFGELAEALGIVSV